MRTKFAWKAAALASFLCLQISVAEAQPSAPAPSSAESAARCAALKDPKWASLREAPLQVNSAALVDAAGDMPQFCEVKGYIRPQVGFVVRLPTTTWNRKFLMGGCGGYCGGVEMASGWTNAALKRGYAITSTDMGHQSTALDGKWAYGNLQAKLDFAYRATHVTAVAAKAILADYYGEPQALSYFQGCSTGGRQGMMEAQRFPNDFDGIIAGAPAMYYSTSSFEILNSGLANIGPKGEQIIGPKDAVFLHKAVVAKCDLLDGLKDNLIEDPRKCDFDPVEVQCKPGQSKDCLNPAQVEAARRIYRGPVNSRGNPIHVGSFPLGSELTWLNRVIGPDGKPGYNVTWMIDRFRYMAFTLDPGPLWNLSDLDLDGDPNRAGGLGAVYSATNPDLRRFKARGGKLLHYQGWQDPSVVPMQSVDYYEMAARAMGGLKATQDFYRLFMVPGMGHCAGGEAADQIDYLTALETWVEKGQAPDVLLGRHVEGGKTTFTRPHFTYPDVARYRGKGDPADAANFKRVKPVHWTASPL